MAESELSRVWRMLEYLFDAVAVIDSSRTLVFANERFRTLASLGNTPSGISGVQDGSLKINQVLELPGAIWEALSVPRLSERPLLDSVSFSFAAGAKGFAQVMVQYLHPLHPEKQNENYFLVVLRDISLDLQNKWRLSENERVISGLRRSHAESQFLWRLSLETPIYIEPSVVLTAISRRLRDELEFVDACFLRIPDDGSPPEPLLTDNRIGSRLREVAKFLAPTLRDHLLRSEIWSFEYQDLGTFWVLNFRPKVERSFFLLARSNSSSNEPNRRSFLEPLGMQISAWLDNRSMYISSITDKLTGLFNRRQFDSRFSVECVLAKERKTSLSLLVADIDFFKKVNDTFGHIVGDEVLKALGTTLKGVVRNTDITARIGGEEFAVILYDTSSSDARIVAEKIRKAVSQLEIPVPGTEQKIRITLSCGIAGFGAKYDTPEAVYGAADEALYRAKEKGRNCTEVADEKID